MRMVCRFNLQVLLITGVTILAVAGVAWADFTFGPPKNLGPVVNGPDADCCPNLSADGLTLYFSSSRPGGFGKFDIYSCTRPSVDADWGSPVNLGAPVNSIYFDSYPCVSGDGLTLYFTEHWIYDDQVGTRLPEGSSDPMNSEVWMSTRASTSDPWGLVVSAGASVNSAGSEFAGVTVSRDGLTLIFTAAGPGRPGAGYTDLWMCSRSTTQEPWGPAVNLGPAVNSSMLEGGPCLSPDGLAVFFETCRGNAPFMWDLWMTTRNSSDDPWHPAVKLDASINTSDDEWNPALSPDGKTLYFTRNLAVASEDLDIYEASIIPIVDFNADAKVDLADLVILVDHWGDADPLCDIGPYPWGDGKVDIQDLKVFTAEWEKQNPPAQP